MGTKTVVLSRIWDTEENEDSQRQPPMITWQTGNNAIAEPYAGKPYTAAEEYQQSNKVDRQAPGELNEVEKHSGPANGSDSFLRIMSGFVHVRDLCLFGALYVVGI